MVKKKKKTDFNFNYMEEVYFPTLKQKLWLFHTDPVWYRFILVGIVLEALVTIFMTPFEIEIASDYHMFLIRIQQIFNTMYFFDLVLTYRQKFFWGHRYPYPNPIRRPAPVMILEIVSVLPFELFLGDISGKDKSANEHRIFMAFLTLHTLKLPRFFYHVYNNRRDLYNEFRTRIIEMVIILTIFCCYIVHMLHIANVLADREQIYDGFQLITCNVAGRGLVLTEVSIRNYAEFEIITPFAAIFMWTIAIYPTCCFMVLSFIENHKHRYDYAHLILMFKDKISKKYILSPKNFKLMMDYFQANWTMRGGFTKSEFDFTQKTLSIEIAMDTIWPAFRHSILFRKAEFYVLRALADKFERHIRMEGEFVYKPNKPKSGLVYIAQGVVEILSTENNDSGILSLASGTCIGEVALIIPHKSTVSFRCKTVCELYELSREKFMIFQQAYTFEYKQLHLKLLETINKARIMKKHNAKFGHDQDIERTRMIWLKYHLHNFMAFKASHKNVHEVTNIYIRRELEDIVEKQKNIFHTYEFLDKLAIRERNFVDVDLVFIRNTCPWILRANSPITKVWEYIVTIATIWCSIAVSYGFCIDYSDTIKLCLGAIHFLFVLDLVVQVITPVDSKSDARTLTSVLSERLRTRGFFLDIVSVYYWKMISFVIDTPRPWYELFKLVKLWRLWKFFDTWSNRFLLNLVFFTTCLGCTVYIVFLYSLSCFFILTQITKEMLAPITIQFASGAGLPVKHNPDSNKSSYAYILANALSVIVQVGVTSMICGTLYLHYMGTAKVVATIYSLSKCVKNKTNNWLWVRLTSYFDVLINDQDVLVSRSNIARLLELPAHFEIVMKRNVHFEALKKMQLFLNMSDEMITSLLLYTELITTYRHSIVVSHGVIYKEVFVLVKGECRTVTEGRYLVTKRNEPLNFLETCYNFPSVTSTVALTECLILKFNFDAYVSVLYKYGAELKIFRKALEMNRDKNTVTLKKLLFERISIVRSRNFKPSFKNFSYFPAKNSFEEFDYHVPFDRIKPFDCVKFILLRTTFYPEGRFLKYYEIFRCCIAFTSACFFTIPAVNVGAYTEKTAGYPYMLALDLFAVLDIYLRMHVAYYTPDGLLVTHPLATAKYYMKHGFFIDFIAVFPFDIFPMKVQYRAFLNAVHALQLHRILALRKYYFTHHLNYVINTITIICLILFIANFISGLIFIYDCYSWETVDQVPVAECRTFAYEITEAHFHILFMVMSAQQCSGIVGKVSPANLDVILSHVISFLTVTGIFTKIIYKAYIFSSSIVRIIEKNEYAVGVRRLIRMLSEQSSHNRYLAKEVANYYDLHWNHVASHNLLELTNDMISALKRDLLFGYYGDNLVRYSMFASSSTETVLFIKNMFLEAKPMVIPKNGYVLTVNDIDEHIYFLNKGSVDVLNVDGSKMLELTAGAIFGNFSGQRYTRIKLSFVANVNTDLIFVPSLDFFKIIAYFPNIKLRFDSISRRTVYYVPSAKTPEPHLRMTFDEYIKAVNKYSAFKMIDYFHLFYVCYIGVCMELYQLAVGEMHILYLSIQYSMDLVHVLREYLKFKLPYKDDHRAPIVDKKKIAARSVNNRLELYVMIISLIYLDIFLVLGYIFLGRYTLNDISYTITALRLNRLVRIYYIIAARRDTQKRLSSNSSNLVKWSYVIYWYVLSYQLIAATTAILDSMLTVDTPNLIKNIDVDSVRNLRYLPSIEKFRMYFRYFYFSNLIHINSNDKEYGPMNTFFNIYVILLFMYHLIVDSMLLAGFFGALVDILVLRRLYLKGSNFLRFYMTKSDGTLIVKDKVVENSRHSWAKNYYKSDYIMTVVFARYLKEVVTDSMYGYLFRRHRVLAHTHIDFLRQLGTHLKKVIYPCNSVIVYNKEVRRCMYFVHKGAVAVYDVDFGYEEIALQILCKGESFGFVQALPSFKALYDYTYVTTKHAEIVELHWDDWNYLLPFFPATEAYIYEEAKKYIGDSYIPFLSDEVHKD